LRVALLALGPVLLAALTAGCGAAGLIHDAYIGPISPAGSIHPYVAGERLEIRGDGGPRAGNVDALLRPYPRDFVRRLNFFLPFARGLQFAVAGLSFVVEKDRTTGKPLPAEKRAALRPGLAAVDCLRLLGPPRRWIKRESGSIMAYGAEVNHDLDIRVGLPPGVAQLVPIPGLSILSWYLSIRTEMAYKTVLFFDRDDVLRVVATNGGPEDEDEEDAGEAGEAGEAGR